MLKLYVWLRDLLQSERGQDMVEYGLITVLVSVAIVIAVVLAGIDDAFGDWAGDLGACISDLSHDSCDFVVWT